jgi:cell wall-associated NlpC family hydrolase
MLKKAVRFIPVIATVLFLWQSSTTNTIAACVPTAIGCVSYDINSFSSWFLKIAFGIAGGIAFLLMIYGFILLGTSKGDPKKVQGAKETITSAIIGLLVTIFSIFIYRFLTINVLNIPLTSNPTVTSSGSSSSSSSSSSSTSTSSSGSSTGSFSSGSSSSSTSADDSQDSSGEYNGNVGGYSGGYYQNSGMFASAHEVLAPISSMAAVSPPTKVIPCHGDMTQYQNELMSKINSVGYKTRNAVVVAANYLATQFPYRVPYHWGGGHNSSIDLDGGFLANGNGGKYTTNWGCPSGVNGLDCSGFVNWAYLTAGFKVVEGNKEYRWNKGNFERVDISRGNCDYIKSRIKPGDVLQNAVGETAHTALVLAYDNDDTVKYVDESGTVGISFMDICTGKRSCKGCGGFERISFMDVYFDKYAIKY